MVRIRPMKCPTPGLAPGQCSVGSAPHHDDNDTVEVFIAAQRLNCKETGRLPGGEAIQASSAVSAHQTQRQGPLGAEGTANAEAHTTVGGVGHVSGRWEQQTRRPKKRTEAGLFNTPQVGRGSTLGD